MPEARAASLLWVGLAMCLVSIVVCGCGGGGASSPTIDLAAADQLGPRSVQLNNYNNWTSPKPGSADYDEQLQALARRDRICMNEQYGLRSGLSPQMLRQLNPSAKVYRLYALCAKSQQDSDWTGSALPGGQFLQTPLSYQDIVTNDWWLRDGNGTIVKENDIVWFIDVGKPGVKEALLENILARVEGKGFDGIVLDYHGLFYISKWVTGRGLVPPLAYGNEEEWFAKAAMPMLAYVIDGIRSRGYEVIVNCAGQHGSSLGEFQWLRGLIDGSVYELWSLNPGGDWLLPHDAEMQINSFLDDPLEAWTADFFLRGPGCIRDSGPDPEYDRKFQVALAMYYVALPPSPALRAKRFYGHYKNSKADWESLWDWRIGEPEALPVKMPDKYFWSRKYTGGLVLLNYDEDQTVTYPLDRRYRTPTGQVLTGSVTVRPHTGMILAVDGVR